MVCDESFSVDDGAGASCAHSKIPSLSMSFRATSSSTRSFSSCPIARHTLNFSLWSIVLKTISERCSVSAPQGSWYDELRAGVCVVHDGVSLAGVVVRPLLKLRELSLGLGDHGG